MAVDLIPRVRRTAVFLFLIRVLVNLLKHIATRSPLCVVFFECGGKDFRVFLASCLSNYFAADASDYRVIQADPFATVLPPDVYGVMAKVSRLPVVVDDPLKSVSRHSTMAKILVSFRNVEDL